jgi:hypothetical protein
VPVGCKVTLYEDEFTGKTAVFPPGNYDVDQMKAAGMDNDMVSSIKVENEIEIDEVAKEGLSRLGLPTAAAAPPAAAPPAAAPTYGANVFTQHEVGGNTGGWGGACTCPNGQVYQVSDKGQECQELNCIGGTPGTCNKYENKDSVTGWSGNKVTCGAAN